MRSQNSQEHSPHQKLTRQSDIMHAISSVKDTLENS